MLLEFQGFKNEVSTNIVSAASGAVDISLGKWPSTSACLPCAGDRLVYCVSSVKGFSTDVTWKNPGELSDKADAGVEDGFQVSIYM